MDGAIDKSLQKQLSKPKVRAPVRRVRLWTRLSPAHLMRVFVDNFVKGCVTFDNDGDKDAHASSFQVTLSYDDDNGAGSLRPRAGRVASARELELELSGSEPALPQQGSVLAESVHLAHKHRAIVTGGNGSSMADLQGQAGVLRITAERNAVIAGKPHNMEALFQTSALHPTGFLQSASRQGAVLGTHRFGHLMPRGGSGRMLERRRSLSATSVSPVASRPLTPVTDMSTFREQSRRRKPSRSTLGVRRASRDVQTPPSAAAASLDAMYITSPS